MRKWKMEENARFERFFSADVLGATSEYDLGTKYIATYLKNASDECASHDKRTLLTQLTKTCAPQSGISGGRKVFCENCLLM